MDLISEESEKKTSEGKPKEKKFRGIFFTTEKMRKAFDSWPEILFIDTTYKLFLRKLITLVICAQDGNGFTHIVGVACVVNEQADTLKSVFEIFKNINPDACSRIKCCMTDKDLTERQVLKEVFPGASLFICEFHVLKIFSRTITTSAFNITAELRTKLLDLIDKMVKSNSRKHWQFLHKNG